jgi:ribosomal protein S18 acetylase RimI-like enzyme
MRKAEQAARGVGRRLLTLDTRSDGTAEALYRGMGWTEAGRIPGYALDAQGVPHGTTLFWKAL